MKRYIVLLCIVLPYVRKEKRREGGKKYIVMMEFNLYEPNYYWLSKNIALSALMEIQYHIYIHVYIHAANDQAEHRKKKARNKLMHAFIVRKRRHEQWGNRRINCRSKLKPKIRVIIQRQQEQEKKKCWLPFNFRFFR